MNINNCIDLLTSGMFPRDQSLLRPDCLNNIRSLLSQTRIAFCERFSSDIYKFSLVVSNDFLVFSWHSNVDQFYSIILHLFEYRIECFFTFCVFHFMLNDCCVSAVHVFGLFQRFSILLKIFYKLIWVL